MFTFKHFQVLQERNTMKVCTDSCILGAWADVSGVNKILDIGTGTGLLTLMIAQRTKAQIDAIEIDKSAFEEASLNFCNSPFSKRIKAHHADIRNYKSEKYDLVISNPPFYENHLKSNNENKNRAKHTVSLSFKDLAGSIEQLLTKNGKAIILLPPESFQILASFLNSYNLYETKILNIHNKNGSPVFRQIGVFAFGVPLETELVTLSIRQNNSNEYSNEFAELLKDYYLIF